MIKLKSLTSEVSECSVRGKSGKRIYSTELKRKICLAASAHGISMVAKAVDVSPSLISSWRSKLDLKNYAGADDTPSVTLKELPSVENSPARPSIARPVLKLTSPSGHCLELDTAITPETIAIVRAFVGGAL